MGDVDRSWSHAPSLDPRPLPVFAHDDHPALPAVSELRLGVKVIALIVAVTEESAVSWDHLFVAVLLGLVGYGLDAKDPFSPFGLIEPAADEDRSSDDQGEQPEGCQRGDAQFKPGASLHLGFLCIDFVRTGGVWVRFVHFGLLLGFHLMVVRASLTSGSPDFPKSPRGFWGLPPVPPRRVLIDDEYMTSPLQQLDSAVSVLADFYLANALTIFGICIVVAIATEKLVRWASGRDLEANSTATSLLSGGAFLVVKNVVGKGLFVGLYAWLYTEHRLTTLDLTSPVVWLTVFFMRDFIYYWVHRAEHRVSALWASHLVHHSPETIGMTTAVRVPWMEALYKPMFGLWLPLIGFNPIAAVAMDVLAALIAQAYHTERFAIAKQGVLGRVIAAVFVTPSTHRVHHGYNPEYIDKNFGAVFIIWDRLFGTHQREVAPVMYGVGAVDAIKRPTDALVGGYPRLIEAARSTRSLPGAITVLMAPPGSPESRGELITATSSIAEITNAGLGYMFLTAREQQVSRA